MAEKLINGTYTELQDAVDSVLRAVHSIGSDTYQYGKKYISSRLIDRDGSTKYTLTGVSSSSLYINGIASNTNGYLRGKLPFILNSDITSDMFKKLRVNPACNFADGTVDGSKLIAYGSHSNTVNDDDNKYGYIQYPKDAVEGANRNQTVKTCVWTAGKALGIHKQLVIGADIMGDITSGVAVYKTYYPTSGWPCNVTGITEETQITDGNTYFIDFLTGARTEIPNDSPLKSIGYPKYFRDVVEIGEYIYFIDQNNYIEKIDKSTLTLVAKSSSTFNANAYNLFKIGEQLYLCKYNGSNSDSEIYTVNSDTLVYSSVTIANVVKNIPDYVKYSSKYAYRNFMISNCGDNYILWFGSKNFGLACSDLSDVAGTVIPELCQFNMTSFTSYRKLTDNVACLSACGNELINDLNEETTDILKICMDNGQVFSVAEWATPFENTGNKEIRITIAE